MVTPGSPASMPSSSWVKNQELIPVPLKRCSTKPMPRKQTMSPAIRNLRKKLRNVSKHPLLNRFPTEPLF